MDRYTAKRRFMRPVVAWRRRRPVPEGLNRVYLEANGYSHAFQRYAQAARQSPGLMLDVDLEPDAVVLDVGAFVGKWSTRLLRWADAHGQGDIHVHAFEPAPSSITACELEHQDEQRFTLHPYGLAGRTRVEELMLSGPGSSVFTDAASRGRSGSTMVKMVDVDEVLRDIGAERVRLVKINIEGGEFELLDRMYETGWLARTGTVLVQFHEFAPDAYRARRRNRRQLAETHVCTWSYPWVWERWDRAASARSSRTSEPP